MSLDEPRNLEAEEATLGAVLMNRDAILALESWLKPDYFWLPKHTDIYVAAVACSLAGTPPDIRTVSDELRRSNKLEAVGGTAYLVHLTDQAPVPFHVSWYAEEVARCGRLRAVIRAGERIAQFGYNLTDAEEAEAESLTAVNNLMTQQSGADNVPLYETVEDLIERMQSPERTYIETGYVDLDKLIGGLFPQDFLIVGARPSVGKTSFALSLAKNLAEQGTTVQIFSLEMGRDQLVQRLAAMECGVDVQRLRLLRITPEEAERVITAMRDLSKLPIFTNDISAHTPASLRASVMRLLQEQPRTVVLIDYLQLMMERDTENRQQEVSSISRALKRLAKEAKVPIVALSQLSRAVEGRTVKIPMLSDLRESGSLEQDADIVMFLHREELYDHNTDKKGVAEIHIAKQRNGPLGVIPMRFDGATTRFDSLAYRVVEGNQRVYNYHNDDDPNNA